MTLVAEHTETDTRERILVVAERLFRQLGYQKTTVGDIAKELRMSPANVYRFFDSKKSIHEGVARTLMGEVEVEARRIAARPGPAKPRLRELLTAHFPECDRLVKDVVSRTLFSFETNKRIFASVILPLCGPALATLGILTVLGSWNNFLWPLVVAQTEDKYTLPVALALYAVGQNATQYGLLLAGSVVVVLPVLALFLFLQRHIMQGIAMTGIK